MSKNTGTSELINYFDLGVNGDVGIAGSLDINTIANATTDTDTFLVSDTGVIKYRTGAQLLSDIGAAPATGGSYLPLAGGTLTGTLNGTSAVFSGDIQSNTRLISSNGGQAIFITANSGGLTNRIEATSGLPLHIVTTGSSLSLAAGGTTPQFTLASTGAATFTSTISATGTIRTDGASNGLLLRNGFTAEIVNPNTNTRDIQFNQDTNATVMFKGNGNVGIGTDNPTRRLYVKGTGLYEGIVIDNGSSSGGGYLAVYQNGITRGVFGVSATIEGGTSSDVAMFAETGGSLRFYVNGSATSSMRLTSSGNVLIGTTTDNGARLQVSGTATVSGTLTGASSIFTNIRVNAAGEGIAVVGVSGNPAYLVTDQSVNNSGKRWRFGHTGAIGGFNSFDFYNQTDNITSLTLASTGAATFSSSVNLGTNANAADTASLNIKQAGTSYNNGIYIERGGERNGYYMYIGGGLDALTFRRNYFGTQSDVMSLTRDGNVGIGMTTSEYGRVSIKSNSTTPYAGFNVYATGNGNFTYINHDNSVGIIGTEFGAGGTGQTPLTFQVGGLERMRITSEGNLRLFITPALDSKIEWFQTPTGNLVQARIWADGNPRLNAQVGGSGGVYLAAGGISWIAASDERLKTDLVPIENGLEKVDSLRSVIGRYINDKEKTKRSFLIAQDVQKVLPEAVVINPLNGELGLSYTEIIPLLVAAIQELNKKINK